MIKYIDNYHKEFVNYCLKKSKNNDCYHKALFYVLGLTEDCRQNINNLYNWSNGCVKKLIKNECGWITGTDMRIIRLAYNLYNNGAPTAYSIEDVEKKNEELMNYLPTALFGYMDPELIEYCFEGIRIRYEMV